ncbi:hypothetical protein MKK88_27685 [Methylobacterium sp. E-005]|uniref:hypothetical protein n=1 Tax=Methylobacterium sp. E-005 TaxID=2836549 RepID=UPI001FB8EB70|nr:hypothetical protein [Methylobacterium sp. E-005]MCJ2089740.1 hypothetical protein [Methylobacterium sp. E-005]
MIADRCGNPEHALSTVAMPARSRRTTTSGSLFGEVSERLPLFEPLPPDVLHALTTSGLGRGCLTASLRARLRKAGYRDLGHLAQTSPEAIASIRKFGPVRTDYVRTFILAEIARWLPGARETHAAGATGARRLERLRDWPVEQLPLDADAIAALGLAGCSCADMAGQSRFELLGTGVVLSGDVDRVVTTLARFLGGGGMAASLPTQGAIDAPASETEAIAARRAAQLATQDREWEDAAPARA